MEKTTMKRFTQLGMDARIEIEKGIDAGHSFNRIAKEIGKDQSTVSREVLRNRIVEYHESSSHCRHTKESCPASALCAKVCIRRHCHGCKDGCRTSCPSYERRQCQLLSKPPYVCNKCCKRAFCSFDMYFYRANTANRYYESRLSESRTGANITPERAKQIEGVLKDGFDRGLSIHHILVSHGGEEAFGISEKTLYTYVNDGIFPGIGRTDHPRKQYKSRRKSLETSYKVDKKCLEGRRYEDYMAFMHASSFAPFPVQIDTVMGRADSDDDCLLTVHFTICRLQLAFVRKRNDAASVAAAFDFMWDALGPDLFRRMFPVVLADNGPEFSDPLSIEADRRTGEFRTSLFYCHPNASYEKGSCEVNHEYIRRIVPKGSPLRMDQDLANLMMSHINSSPREELNDLTPYEVFSMIYGEPALHSLGLKSINPLDVVLKPRLLKQ